jgi:serine/threonine-protein kinase
MSDVYLCHDQLLGRQVAVKVLHKHFAEDGEFVERFRREASSAAALSHPNIVGIFDRGEWDGTYYIAMEYVPGRTLKTIVRENGALDVVLAIDLTLQVLQAARFAHSRGVIHRDLKPQNVIVDEEGRALVTDFGIARAGASEMTMTGSVLGTAQYLSPEQAQGYDVTEAADLYSVGVILYELLTGVLPFEGETAVAIAFKQVAAEPVPPSAINSTVPPTLDAIVLKALAKAPADRFTTDDGFIHALQLERDRLTGDSGPASMTQLRGTPVPPTAATMMAPAAAVAAGDGDEDEQPPGSKKALWWTLAVLALIAVAVAAFFIFKPKQEVTVPNVVGQTEQMAFATLRADGLEPLSTPVHSATKPAGQVIAQSPSAGNSIAKGSKVELEVSSGPSSKAVPNVVGRSEKTAIAELQKDGFKVEVQPVASASVPQGTVVSTEPSAGTLFANGSTIKLNVSQGPEKVRIPNVVGGRQEAAEEALRAAKLRVGTVTKRSSSEPAGTVLSQSPTAGEQVNPETAVSLVVAEASSEVAIPNVKGESAAGARRSLESAGFKVKETKTQTSEKERNGTVVSQSPDSGTKGRKGATVTIAVGEYVPTTTPTTTTPPAGN